VPSSVPQGSPLSPVSPGVMPSGWTAKNSWRGGCDPISLSASVACQETFDASNEEFWLFPSPPPYCSDLRALPSRFSWEAKIPWDLHICEREASANRSPH
jgi:hypothetical protein